MTIDRGLPSGSQTAGPFFRIGLEYLQAQAPLLDPEMPGRIEIRGRVLDRDRAPVPDALLEFWGAGPSGAYSSEAPGAEAYPAGFHRVSTDLEGGFSLVTRMPGPVPFPDGRMQAPHLLVLVFARGLLRHLITRIYFEHEPGNAADPVLLKIPAGRRATLMARHDGVDSGAFHWDIVLQGEDETVFFAW
jgi:protocatechuate 3,4-dioxygenase, alpha subunit